MKDEAITHQPGRAGIFERVIKGLSLGMLALLIVVLVTIFSNWVSAVIFAIRYPHQIDYGEGIVWQQALMILGGEGYSDITRLPFVVFHYPPVFHLLSGLFAGVLSIEFLAAGRIVSVVSTLGSTIVAGVLIFRAVRARESLIPALLCAFTAALIAFTFAPLAYWSPLMRVDMAAIFFGFLGIYFGLRAPEHPRCIYVSALFFVLAMYTKQTSVAAPLATLIFLMVIRPRLAGLGVLAALGFGVPPLFALQLYTDGGFLEHIVSYNMNRHDLSRLEIILFYSIMQLIYLSIVLYFSLDLVFKLFHREPNRTWAQTLRHRISYDQYDRLRYFGFIYLLLTTLSLISITKIGASLNYLLEWMFAWSLMIGLFLRWPMKLALGSFGSAKRQEPARCMSGVRRLFLGANGAILFAALLYQALFISPPNYQSYITSTAYQEQQRELLRRVREASKPVISDDMVAVLRSGKQVVWEPAIFAELAALNRWDEGAFIQMIRSNDFAFFVTKGRKGEPLFDSRYNASVSEAIEAAYPRTEQLAGYIIHLPPK